MLKILVTGITGEIGKLTVSHLLKKGVPPSDIIGLSRKIDVNDGLIEQNVEMRIGDYLNYESLLNAFKGINKIMLTSAVAFSDRFTQHYNVITAARQAGVKHIVYMAIMRKEGSRRIMPEITESDLFTEHLLRSSGLNYTIVYHPPFTDVLSLYYGAHPLEDGIEIPASNGKMAPATRDELAEAHAEILSTAGHENKTYSLGGSELISFEDIAHVFGETFHKPVSFSTISKEEYIDKFVAKGTPRKVADFLTSWVVAIEEGEFDHQSGDLERLLGRKTKSFIEYLQSN
ncbi:SDR family oxidoreductase [Mucilaginibacter achroorhodeus]|uniref:SDR family oxidoreductase n=1 Tax=Mucilaginibacter achroorhodeus TaxID=2599294 RepID=A0A563U021_9SPHI|nr:SDR family oxidoreductase [Mucilaginibacter achroorhodeus]TWR24976.1 SDR family oxidoreductase [Mucilaginibacter achroorhodeus]